VSTQSEELFLAEQNKDWNLKAVRFQGSTHKTEIPAIRINNFFIEDNFGEGIKGEIE